MTTSIGSFLLRNCQDFIFSFNRFFDLNPLEKTFDFLFRFGPNSNHFFVYFENIFRRLNLLDKENLVLKKRF